MTPGQFEYHHPTNIEEAVSLSGAVIAGAITSGAYAHHSGVSMAMGYVSAEFAANTAENAFEIQILGERCPATLIQQALFDPRGERMRG